MATIVTMENNVIVVSPRGYEDSEPELVHENMTFCLDGSQFNPSNAPTPASNTQQPPNHYQPERGSFLSMRKGLGSSERSRTDTTAGSSESTTGASSASPVPILTKNLSTQSTSTSNSPHTPDTQVPPVVTSSIFSLQNMCSIDNNGNTRRESEQSNHEEEDDDDDDYYTNQQTPPFPPPDTATAAALSRPIPNNAGLSPTMGTPPSSLYAEAQLPSKGPVLPGSQQQQPSKANDDSTAEHPMGKGSESNSKTTNNHLGLSISPVSSGFPLDGSTPPKGSQPMLYSAIGSLENCSAGSLKSIWNNNKARPHKNGIASKFDSANLIAPKNQRQHSSGEKILSHPSDLQPQKPKAKSERISGGNDTSTPDKFGDKTGATQRFSTGLPGPPPPAPPTKQYQSAFEASFQKVQQKVDAAQNRHQPKKKTPPMAAATPTADNTAGACAKPKESKRSSMRKGRSSRSDGKQPRKSVKIDDASLQRKKRSKKPTELFRPSCDAYTPRMERKKITYKPAELRTPVQKMATTMGTLSRPNFRDALRRVAMLIRQHIVKIEHRFNIRPTDAEDDEGLFKRSMKEAFAEENFATPRYKCTVVRVPMARPGMVFGLKKMRPKYEIPSEEEIYEFAHQLFKTVQLSSECSIVCLIYIERLMERSKVPLLASTWRPIFMCGLLLASKVWQDLSSWNIEFASVYPQFSLDSINKLELQFLRMVKWDLYISSSLYAKYYFALRSILEKPDFRQRYNRMVGGVDSVAASEALKIQKRTEQVKEEALLQLSRSM